MKTLKNFLEIKDRHLQNIARHFPGFITPNALTMARFALLPLIIYLIIINAYGWALAIFILAFALDLFDGPLARVRHRTTVFGAMLDPLADKILFLSVLVMVAYERLPAFLVITMIVLEVIIMGIAGILAPVAHKLNFKFHIGANKYGKYKMLLQVIGMVILLTAPGSQAAREWTILIFSTAVLLAGMSIGDHIKSAYKK